ncbi:MAG TPA: SigE family RNA polymerase sigma factor [Mycobacteriales bacterium]|nr:SigE family RNA polymerase sigma factor [Mycobacteriales bacterium]
MDEQEFRRFVSTRGSALCRSAYLLTGDWQLGEDLVQTALASTWARHRLLRNPEAVEAYVRRAMARTLISWRRRRSFGELPVEDVEVGIVVEPVEGAVERNDMWSALRRLPVKQRAVLVLRYYEDLSEHQIADVLGCSRGTVKSHAARGLRALRDQGRTMWEAADEQN